MLAEAQGLKREETIAKLKEFYDGYHFSPESPDVFNPFSLLNCFTKKNFGAYWFASGTHTYLINMMKKFEVLPSDISRVEADEGEFDAPTENMPTIMPLLYQSGYSQRFALCGKPVVKVGINFDSDKGNIEDWEVGW